MCGSRYTSRSKAVITEVNYSKNSVIPFFQPTHVWFESLFENQTLDDLRTHEAGFIDVPVVTLLSICAILIAPPSAWLILAEARVRRIPPLLDGNAACLQPLLSCN